MCNLRGAIRVRVQENNRSTKKIIEPKGAIVRADSTVLVLHDSARRLTGVFLSSL